MGSLEIPMSDFAEKATVRTRSVPTAAALMLAGFNPIRVQCRDSGGAMIVFPAAARNALDKFLALKDTVDDLIERGDSLR